MGARPTPCHKFAAGQFLQCYLDSSLTQKLLLKTHLGVCLRSQINNSDLLFKLCAQAKGFIKSYLQKLLVLLYLNAVKRTGGALGQARGAEAA